MVFANQESGDSYYWNSIKQVLGISILQREREKETIERSTKYMENKNFVKVQNSVGSWTLPKEAWEGIW